MADFCKQCAIDLGFPGSDLVYRNLRRGEYMPALCDECGFIQVNNKGECISSDCLCPGHHIPMDKNVSYYITEEDFSFGNEPVVLTGYGEWSHTIPEQHIEIKSIDEIPCNVGDMVYVCSEGTFNLYTFVLSNDFKLGWEAGAKYECDGSSNLEEVLKSIDIDHQLEFILGWNEFYKHIT